MLIEINTLHTVPIYEQLRDQIVLGIAGRKLVAGEALPSVRRLAADLGINLHTVNKAYAMLGDEGYIVMDRRKGAIVAQTAHRDAAFTARLSDKLIMTAAEGICHGMSEEEYLSLCTDRYRSAYSGAGFPDDGTEANDDSMLKSAEARSGKEEDI